MREAGVPGHFLLEGLLPFALTGCSFALHTCGSIFRLTMFAMMVSVGTTAGAPARHTPDCALLLFYFFFFLRLFGIGSTRASPLSPFHGIKVQTGSIRVFEPVMMIRGLEFESGDSLVTVRVRFGCAFERVLVLGQRRVVPVVAHAFLEHAPGLSDFVLLLLAASVMGAVEVAT